MMSVSWTSFSSSLLNENFYIKFLVFILCYFIGSFPTAYVIVKKTLNKDLTKEGSGNVGTYNAIVVSKSKSTGIIVLFIDLLKGFLPVFLMLFVFKFDYKIAAIASCFLIAGHNYPIWLKFKGGRGLAPGAGIFLVLNYFILSGWLIAWSVSMMIKKDVLIANSAATLSLFIYIFLINKFDFFVVSYNLSSFSLTFFTVSSLIITVIVLSRHLEVLKSFFNKNINQ